MPLPTSTCAEGRRILWVYSQGCLLHASSRWLMVLTEISLARNLQQLVLPAIRY